MPPNRPRRTRKRAERDGLVVRVEQAVELRPARFHPFRETGFRQSLVLHEDIELPRDHFLVDALVSEEFVEGRSDLTLLFHMISFLRLVAVQDRRPAFSASSL